jgi:predicted dehydrogenase
MGAIHAAILKKIEGVTLLGVYDQSQGRAQALSKMIGCKAFNSLDEVIRRKPLFVSICTPTETHVPVALRFVRHGVHVFVEKPLAESVNSAHELVTEAKSTGSLIGVGHLERHNPAFIALRSRLAHSKGQVITGEFRRMNPKPNRYRNTGVISELSIHDFDLALTLWGRPKGVKSYFVTDALSGLEVSSLTILNYGGFQVSVRSSWLSRYKERSVFVSTDYVRLSADLLEFRLIEKGEDSSRTSRYAPSNTVEAELVDFLIAIKEGRLPHVSAQDAIEALRLAEASLSSAYLRKEVNL